MLFRSVAREVAAVFVQEGRVGGDVGCGGAREDVAGGTEVGGTRVARDTGGSGRNRGGAGVAVEGEGHGEVGRGW